MHISVVIPTRDRHGQLLRCLRAVARARQPDGGVEVIVVNDGGRPPQLTALRAAADGVAVRLVTQPGAGPAAARNRGAAVASGELLAFTDDDCEPAHDWLTVIDERFADDPTAVIAGRAESSHPDNDWATASQLLTDHLHRWYNRDPDRSSFMTSNNLALGATIFSSLGGFDPSFPTAAAEDREFSERALRAGHRLVYVPGAVVRHRHRLTAPAFVRQHYGYGRGARRALEARRVAGGGMVFEPPGFYMQMLRSPWREHRRARAARLTVLLALSQAAHAAGFVRQSLS